MWFLYYVCSGEQIGEGGYSVVHSATSNIDKSKVAVKIISKKKIPEQDLEALHQEVDILKQLHHKNITRLIDFFDENDNYYACYVHYMQLLYE